MLITCVSPKCVAFGLAAYFNITKRPQNVSCEKRLTRTSERNKRVASELNLQEQGIWSLINVPVVSAYIVWDIYQALF
jgi:hypothetical protein